MFFLVAVGVTASAAPTFRLVNRHVTAEFNSNGLVSLGAATVRKFSVTETLPSLQIDGNLLTLRQERVHLAKQTLSYVFDSGTYQVEVVYELQPTWSFVSKQIRVTRNSSGKFTIDHVHSLELALNRPTNIRSAGGASAYLIDSSGDQEGLFVAQQNPFPEANLHNGLSLGYTPKIIWDTKYGAFESDRILLGPWKKSGCTISMPTVREWQYVPDPLEKVATAPEIDLGAYDAIRRCIDDLTIVHPSKSLKIHIPWCENDYQIDLAKPGGPAQYERIIDQAKAIGCDTVLFTPQNSNVSTRSESTDAWAWESLLWLGYGPKIRKGEWNVEDGPIHPSVQHFLNYAKERHVQLLAYVYPTLAWSQNPEWTRWASESKLPLGGYIGADTGNRDFQDWFVRTLVKFCDRTGLAGVSFDHWWIAYDQPTASSRYAQWYGCRRILEELRRARPNMVIDGRQQYQNFGPWTWLGGSYPHPTSSDEQPASFSAFPDLHTDRVSGDRQRYASYWYTVRNFVPPVLNPGFLTHQTQRNTPDGFTTEPFRVKDWDVLGWRYSVLSSVGTAPYNSVVSMIPARDPEEAATFSKTDKKWFADWISWPDRHRDLIAYTRPILGQPMVGKVDGTSMINRDHGFLFLYNPNYGVKSAHLVLDRSIGIEFGDLFVVRQVEPVAKTLGIWHRGDQLDILITGTCATVLQVSPAVSKPLQVLNAFGRASLRGGELEVEALQGEYGTKKLVQVSLPPNTQVRTARANGQLVPFFVKNGVASLAITFEGEPFAPAQWVPLEFSGVNKLSATGSFTVPHWVLRQLTRRKLAWPVSYTPDDLTASWLGPDRLLLFLSIAEASDQMAVSLVIDGKPYPLKKAYNSVYKEVNSPGTFVGFYADVAALADGAKHTVQLSLPKTLTPGQFQGLYFDNVEAELTSHVVPQR